MTASQDQELFFREEGIVEEILLIGEDRPAPVQTANRSISIDARRLPDEGTASLVEHRDYRGGLLSLSIAHHVFYIKHSFSLAEAIEGRPVG